jgi:hypothetical protein
VLVLRLPRELLMLFEPFWAAKSRERPRDTISTVVRVGTVTFTVLQVPNSRVAEISLDQRRNA